MSQKVKTWESHVPGCFGGSDHIFAGHPAEEKRAKELRKVCSEQRTQALALRIGDTLHSVLPPCVLGAQVERTTSSGWSRSAVGRRSP